MSGFWGNVYFFNTSLYARKDFVGFIIKCDFFFLKGPVRFYNNERKASILLKQFQGKMDTFPLIL